MKILFVSFITEIHTTHKNSEVFEQNYIVQTLCLTDICNCSMKSEIFHQLCCGKAVSLEFLLVKLSIVPELVLR